MPLPLRVSEPPLLTAKVNVGALALNSIEPTVTVSVLLMLTLVVFAVLSKAATLVESVTIPVGTVPVDQLGPLFHSLPPALVEPCQTLPAIKLRTTEVGL